MPYVEIPNFKFGMDRRRLRANGVPNTLWKGVNCHVSRGGDIERAKKFVTEYTLPSGTFGLAQTTGQIWTFGSADLAASMPAGVQYQRLQSPSASPMRGVLHSNVFEAKHYVIAEYEDGGIHHFYDGTRVSAWDALSDANSSRAILVDYLARRIAENAAVDAFGSGDSVIITATNAGTAFTISVSATNGSGVNDQTITATTLAANVAAVAGVRATGTVTITGGTSDPGVNAVSQVTIGATNLLASAVDYGASTSATAARLAVGINNNTSTSGYSASAAGAIVTIQAAPGTGTAPNGLAVATVLAGDVTATTSGTMSGGVAAVTPVAQITRVTLGGTYEATDSFTVTINGTAYTGTGRSAGHGTYAFVYKRREYFPAGSLLRYSKFTTANDMSTSGTPATDAGFINLASDSEGSDRLASIAPYQNFLAVFSQQAIRIYSINTDATQNLIQQTLENTGTVAPRSVVPYGNIDVFYLDRSGVRSIQARDVTNAAFVDDAGSAVDPFVQEWINSLAENVVERAVGVIEPVDSRFMLAIGARIFVFSYFPKAKVAAWTYYEPGFTVTDFVRAGRRLYARDTSTIYLYGGRSGNTYPGDDEQNVQVELPFSSTTSPATFKKWNGFDISCTNTWKVDFLADPRDETKVISGGRPTGYSYNISSLALVGENPVFAVNLTCSKAGSATLSSLAFHYTPTEAA